MLISITSPENDIFKHIKSLHQKSSRDKFGEFFIEGYRIVKDAFQSRAEFQYILVSEDANNEIKEFASKIDVPLYVLKNNLFKQISDTENPQGIMAVLKKLKYSTDDFLNSKEKFVLLLENIQDPGNMGTIIRTADAAGISGIIISKGSVDIYNPKVLRSTMGSVFHLPIVLTDDFLGTIDTLNRNRYKLFAAHLRGEVFHFDADMSGKAGIIIGNEANGISNEASEKCKLLKIPMSGKAESLNASISAGVLMYEYVRQTHRQTPFL